LPHLKQQYQFSFLLKKKCIKDILERCYPQQTNEYLYHPSLLISSKQAELTDAISPGRLHTFRSEY
jgi:hypothetical protein